MEDNIKEFEAGEIIFRQGTKGSGFFIIEDGSVEVYKESSHGEIPLVCLGPGEVLGLLTFYDGRPRMASARARTHVKGKLISPDKTSPKIPSWVSIILKEYAIRLEQINNLYSRSISATRDIKRTQGETPLVAAQIASLIATLVPYVQTKNENGQKIFDLELMGEKCQAILDYAQEDVADILEVFCNQGLIKIVEDPDGKKQLARADSAGHLDWFAAFARMAGSGKVKKMVENPLSFSERKALLNLPKFLEKQSMPGEQTARIPISLIVEAFEQACQVNFPDKTIANAQALGFIEVMVHEGDEVIVFHPQNLVRTIIGVNVISQLRRQPEARDREAI